MSKDALQRAILDLSIASFTSLSEDEDKLKFVKKIDLTNLENIFSSLQKNLQKDSNLLWDILEENQIAPQEMVDIFKFAMQQPDLQSRTKYLISKVMVILFQHFIQ